MSAVTNWVDVEFVMADGSVEKSKAVDVGEGWCDCIIDDAVYATRFFAKSDGKTDPPMNMVRLAKPFHEYNAKTTMKYSVTFYTAIDEYDWVCPHHFVADSPQNAAIAERKYVFDECLGLENYEIFDKCYDNDEPDCTELLVLCEDGKSWLVTIESSPTTYDVRREKPIVWEHVVTSCEPTNIKFRWHEYTEADLDEDEDVGLSRQELLYVAVHHVCKGEPCAECTKLDATIAARTQSKESPKS